MKCLRISRTNIREVHEMRTTTVAVCMHIGIYTVRELHDSAVVMALQFCLHEVVAKNWEQFATFFWTSTVHVYKFHKYQKMADTMNFIRTKPRKTIFGNFMPIWTSRRHNKVHLHVSAHVVSHRSYTYMYTPHSRYIFL